MDVRQRRTVLAVALGVVMVSLDGTIVHVANPAIARDLGLSLTDLQWVTTGYLLALATVLILGGKLGDRFGHRRIFTIGVTGFALASLGCGLAHSAGLLIAFRVLQGIAGALLVPNTLAILRSTFRQPALSRAIGIWGAASALAAAAGPIAGGLLVEYSSWRAIFLLNVPIGLAAAAIAMRWVAESHGERSGGFDLAGAGLLAAGLLALVFGLTGANSASLAVAVPVLIGFVIRHAAPPPRSFPWRCSGRDQSRRASRFSSPAMSRCTAHCSIWACTCRTSKVSPRSKPASACCP